MVKIYKVTRLYNIIMFNWLQIIYFLLIFVSRQLFWLCLLVKFSLILLIFLVEYCLLTFYFIFLDIPFTWKKYISFTVSSCNNIITYISYLKVRYAIY